MYNIMTTTISAVVLATSMGSATMANAQTRTTEQVITAECTYEATNVDGSLASCYSEVSVLHAPAGFVFAKDSLKGGFTSKRGSKYNCYVSWGDWRDVVPGIAQPATVTLQAHARSPRHHGARGSAKCRYTISLARLP